MARGARIRVRERDGGFGLQFGHGLGLGLHERPIISRLNSLDHPMEIKEGMVFALETYCPASDGVSAARIEEEVVVTADGCEVITLFPADELLRRQRVLRAARPRCRPTRSTGNQLRLPDRSTATNAGLAIRTRGPACACTRSS